MQQQASKSELRQKLDALSDARADLEAAPFYEKEKKIRDFINELEVFLDNVVLTLDNLQGGKNG